MPAVPETITVQVPMAFRRRGGRKRVVAPDGQELVLARGPQVRIDSTLVKALARAFRWRRMLESGRFSTVADLAARERINASYVSRVLRLTLLAPEIVKAVLDGALAAGLTLPGSMKGVPMEWENQRNMLTGNAPCPTNRPSWSKGDVGTTVIGTARRDDTVRVAERVSGRTAKQKAS